MNPTEPQGVSDCQCGHPKAAHYEHRRGRCGMALCLCRTFDVVTSVPLVQHITKPEPLFGTHIAEAKEVIKDWIKPAKVTDTSANNWEHGNGVCGALIHVGFEGATTCANPKPCKWHNEDGSQKRTPDAKCRFSNCDCHGNLGANAIEHCWKCRTTVAKPARKSACDCRCHNGRETFRSENGRCQDCKCFEGKDTFELSKPPEPTLAFQKYFKAIKDHLLADDWEIYHHDMEIGHLAAMMCEVERCAREEAIKDFTARYPMSATKAIEAKARAGERKRIVEIVRAHGKQNTYEGGERLVYETTTREIISLLTNEPNP
jgi:hypothetical protein